MPGVNKENQKTDSGNLQNNNQQPREEVELSQTDRLNKRLLQLFLDRINKERTSESDISSDQTTSFTVNSDEDWE